MSAHPLKGHKIAVVTESEFIPEEIATYKKKFAEYGAELHIVSRLWPDEKAAQSHDDDPATFPPFTALSDVDKAGETPQTLTIDEDFRSLKLGEFSAVIMSANYTSCRLRYNTDQDRCDFGQSSIFPPRSSPLVRFFYDAMMMPGLVKGFLCHALWTLTPVPELLAGRRVTCHRVMEADARNAGAEIVEVPGGIVLDRDIITGDSGGRAAEFADAIKDQILAFAENPPPATANPAAPPLPKAATKVLPKKRRILMLVSEFGYWGEELVGPIEIFDQAGYSVNFCTPTGKRPVAITVSMDTQYIDPPLGRSVTSPEMAAKVQQWDNPASEQGKRLENPRSLAEWFPQRPYWSSPMLVRASEIYNARQELAAQEAVTSYDALVIVGGSGPIVDLVNNRRVHDLILAFYNADKPIVAECYGVTCLAFARDINMRESILKGKHVTGHLLEYDYLDGTGFMKSRGSFYDINMGPPPYPLEYILRDATAPDGRFHGNFGKPTSVIVDYPFITGRSTPDSYLCGRKLTEVLDGVPPLRQWGF